jgi:hypothetical protein
LRDEGLIFSPEVSRVEQFFFLKLFFRFVSMLEERSTGLCLKTFSTFLEQDWVKWQGMKTIKIKISDEISSTTSQDRFIEYRTRIDLVTTK